LEILWCGTNERTQGIFSVEMETSIKKCGQASFIYKVVTAINGGKWRRQVHFGQKNLKENTWNT
jgi:hypothetical protein